ncbi:hypothetical protein DL98DRAFT_83128 [Cadophora sp. DSE1049]|nr:hypothetical protein DL98DRAFT_83128 [Cadophora sp. DSE1049]
MLASSDLSRMTRNIATVPLATVPLPSSTTTHLLSNLSRITSPPLSSPPLLPAVTFTTEPFTSHLPSPKKISLIPNLPSQHPF